MLFGWILAVLFARLIWWMVWMWMLKINLATTFRGAIDTNVTNEEISLFVKLGQKIASTSIRKVVLDADRTESVLDVGDPANYGGQFVLDPKSNNWHDLAEYVQGEIFNLEEK